METKNPLEELVEATTIRFPRPLSFEEAKKVLVYISDYLPARLTNTYEIHENIRSPTDRKELAKLEGRDESDYALDRGTVKISSTISREKNFAFDILCSLNEISSDFNLIDGFRFQTTPGYDNINERIYHDKIPLWNHVRQAVTKYFLDNPNPTQ